MNNFSVFFQRVMAIAILNILGYGFFFETACSKEIVWPLLKIKDLSDSAVVIVNYNKIKPDLLGYCRISPGLNVVQIEINGIPQYTASYVFKPGEEHSIELGCIKQCASLDIVSDPFGASVYLNGAFAGMTPYFNAFLKSGEYTLRVTHKGYEPISRSIVVSNGKPLMMTLNLEPSKVFQDSMSALQKTQKKSRQVIQKILFSSLAASLASGGIYFNMNAHQQVSKADEQAAVYDQARSNFIEYRNEYYSNRDDARKAIETRNMFYLASGACILGFAFSFVF
jgi:hypothetical protein